MIDRTSLEAEKADYEKQISEAQQNALVWQQKLLVANGALQAINALLGKLDAPAVAE
jgi:hypothetical protein